MSNCSTMKGGGRTDVALTTKKAANAPALITRKNPAALAVSVAVEWSFRRG